MLSFGWTAQDRPPPRPVAVANRPPPRPVAQQAADTAAEAAPVVAGDMGTGAKLAIAGGVVLAVVLGRKYLLKR